MPLIIILLVSLLVVSPAALASDYNCPKKIAGISQNAFTEQATRILKNIYAELRCRPEFVMMPARRGITAFVNGAVDGEVLRLPSVEKNYRVNQFIRSDTPLMEIENLIVSSVQQDPRLRESVIGYQLGIMWQMDYVENKTAVSFNQPTDIITAFNDGKLSQFLTTRSSLKAYLENGRLQESDITVSVLSKEKLYHYLKPDFQKFMTALSGYIEKNKPFENFSLQHEKRGQTAYHQSVLNKVSLPKGQISPF